MHFFVSVMSVLLLSTIVGCGGDYTEKEGSTAEPLKVDILFVVDNSGSMSDEAEGLIREFDGFIDEIDADIDYQVAITTTSDRYSDGFTPEPDPGEVGLLLGESLVVAKGDPTVVSSFQQNIACWATCWSGYEMPTDSSYSGLPGDCTFPENGVASKEYLDCVCLGIEYPVESVDWDDNALCGSGEEKPIEAVLQSLCRSVQEPPEACNHLESEFDPARDTLANPDWLRFGAHLVVVIVTDEGDSSDLFGGGEDDPAEYLAAFSQLRSQITVTAIGPDLSCDLYGDCVMNCNSGGATLTGVQRIKNIVEATGGIYRSITEGGAGPENLTDCEVADFSPYFYDLGLLIKNL